MIQNFYEAIIIGVSAGGLEATSKILSDIPADFPVPIVIVQHMSRDYDSKLAECLDKHSHLPVKEITDKESVISGVYVPPSGYHLAIEPDKSFSFSVDKMEGFSCPSIDVFFETAADTYEHSLIAIILTGANSDGSKGIARVKELGGTCIVQTPQDAYVATMPEAAIKAITPDYVVPASAIAPLLISLVNSSSKHFNQGKEHA